MFVSVWDDLRRVPADSNLSDSQIRRYPAAMRSDEIPATTRLFGMISGLRSFGLGPSEIARAAKVSRQSLWRFENGKGLRPTYAVFERIEKLYRQRLDG
jgi:transcriptional regulator with XRE-family HTH domain